jgi:hypothetical protein
MSGGHHADHPDSAARSRILDAQLVQCRRVDNSFTQSAAAGLQWLTAGGPGPLTGTLATSIDFQSIVRELAVAEDIIFGSPSPGRDYARGLEHALLWAENATAGPRARCRADEAIISRNAPIQP